MADIFQFEQWALSARGLMARPILPNNQPAFSTDIATIGFVVHNVSDNVEIAAGTLDPAVVMYPTLQKPWKKDLIGFTLLWPFPGSYVPEPGKIIRFKLTPTIINPHGNAQLSGKSFIMVWQADTKDPLG